MLKCYVFVIIISLQIQVLFAADSLFVSMNSKSLKKGDTLKVDCYFNFKTRAEAAVSLNVWIEDLQKTSSWKFRYPILNGKCSFDLILNNKLPDAVYAINFLVQPSFFSINGKINDYKANSKGLLMLMLDKNTGSYMKTLKPNEKGSFTVGKLVFKDAANFIFSEIGNKGNDLMINIETPLDSAFTPIASFTDFVTIGNPITPNSNKIKSYEFKNKSFADVADLGEVVVTTTMKKNIEKFDETYATGLFTGGRVFDGIDDNQISMASDVLLFLNGRVPGLQINFTEEGYNLSRRGSAVDVYVDEFRVDTNVPIFVNASDVAMIKVFDPLEGPGTAPGGSIAIYTKRGVYAAKSKTKNYFLVKGYTATQIVWK